MFIFLRTNAKSPGTKIKILESLFYGATTLCTKNSISGIKNVLKLENLIITNKKELTKDLLKITKKKKNVISKKFENYYNFEKK